MSEVLRYRIMQILANHRGRAHAIPRREVERALRNYSIDIDDRRVRLAYSVLPICSCDDGLFIPVNSAEVEAFREYLRPHMGPEKVTSRVGIIYAVYPGLVPAYGKQMDLNMEGARP
jgi:hypothetical protein